MDEVADGGGDFGEVVATKAQYCQVLQLQELARQSAELIVGEEDLEIRDERLVCLIIGVWTC